jgi:hypothetical protein
MTEEEIDKICNALDQSVKPMGYAKFEDSMAESADRFAQIAEDMKTMADRAATRRWLRESFPNPDPAEIQVLLRLLPNLVYLMRQMGPRIAKALPHRRGGRPSAVTAKLRHQICKDIGDLLIKRVPLAAAYKRLGQRYCVSPRTVQRIWNEREAEQT